MFFNSLIICICHKKLNLEAIHEIFVNYIEKNNLKINSTCNISILFNYLKYKTKNQHKSGCSKSPFKCFVQLISSILFLYSSFCPLLKYYMLFSRTFDYSINILPITVTIML